jgi:beta-1,4-N-acetylglucosaminyltransferase
MMIVVPNPTLLDNHQDQLAVALEEMGYLRAANVELVLFSYESQRLMRMLDYRNLVKVLEEFDPSTIKPFPQFDGSRFARIVDEVMGFT